MVDSNILTAIKMLEDNGYEAYIVGGAVRDFLLDVEVSDYDIATNASLDEATIVFKDYETKRYISKNMTIGVKINHTYFELSTYKGNNIEEDLLKRDFSVNSMAYHPILGLVDPYHGFRDLFNHELKTLRTPKETFEEDPIRILRAIRFVAEKNFKLNQELKKGIDEYSYLLKNIKNERVSKEIDVILLTSKPSYYITEFKSVFYVLIPKLRECEGFNQKCPKWHNLDVLSHILKVLDSTKCDLVLRLAALFHDICKVDVFFLDDKGVGHFYGHAEKSTLYAREILSKYCYNHKLIDRVCKIIYYHDYQIDDNDNCALKLLYSFGIKDLDLYLGLRRADIIGQNPNLYYRLDIIDSFQERIKKLLDTNRIITYKNLAIDGNILKELGFEGEDIGLALEIILKKVIKKELKNNPDKLYDFAAELRFHLNEFKEQE